MAKIRPEEKNTPAFSGLPAGWRPRQRGPISSQIRLKTFVSLSFYRFLHPFRHLSVGPEEKNTSPFRWERRKKTLAPLSCRRTIAMLGLLYRVANGLVAESVCSLF